MQVFQDGKCLLPGPVGGIEIIGRAVGVAEMTEGVGLVVAVAEFTVAVESMLIRDRGLGVAAEVMADISDAVPGGCFAVPVAEFAV